MRPTKTQLVLKLVQKGLVRSRDLDSIGVPRTYLTRLVNRGLLEKVDRGVYRQRDADVTELHSIADVVKRVPHGVVCLLSALGIHGLTTQLPHAVWLMINSRARAPKAGSTSIEVIRASGEALSYGLEIRIVEGVKVRLTNPAKTVADCFRYRRHVGLDVALEALRDYLNRRQGTHSQENAKRNQYGIETLVRAARASRVYTVIRPYLEALA